jgi:hypothetical protein
MLLAVGRPWGAWRLERAEAGLQGACLLLLSDSKVELMACLNELINHDIFLSQIIL